MDRKGLHHHILARVTQAMRCMAVALGLNKGNAGRLRPQKFRVKIASSALYISANSYLFNSKSQTIQTCLAPLKPTCNRRLAAPQPETARPAATPPNKSPSTCGVSGKATRSACRNGRNADEPPVR